MSQKQQREMARRMEKQRAEAIANQPVLPSDPKLLSLHREFIIKAEKLAREYEKKKQPAKAREVYESLIRLVPKYANAENGLKRILDSQASQNSKVTKVLATDAWQDSGATLVTGMPVTMHTQGSWKLVFETESSGIEIPEDYRLRNRDIKLGSLIGVIVASPAEMKDAKPFPIKSGETFQSPKTGQLYLRMYDVDPTDNEGEIFVRIHSTFAE